jgi:hypothetical protein
MRKSMLCVLAVLAAAVSTSAVAKDIKQNKQAVSATKMSDSEMDRVTAGGNAYGHEGTPAWQFNGGNARNAPGHLKPI